MKVIMEEFCMIVFFWFYEWFGHNDFERLKVIGGLWRVVWMCFYSKHKIMKERVIYFFYVIDLCCYFSGDENGWFLTKYLGRENSLGVEQN